MASAVVPPDVPTVARRLLHPLVVAPVSYTPTQRRACLCPLGRHDHECLDRDWRDWRISEVFTQIRDIVAGRFGLPRRRAEFNAEWDAVASHVRDAIAAANAAAWRDERVGRPRASIAAKPRLRAQPTVFADRLAESERRIAAAFRIPPAQFARPRKRCDGNHYLDGPAIDITGIDVPSSQWLIGCGCIVDSETYRTLTEVPF